MAKKWTVLFIKDEKSMFEINSEIFKNYFQKVDIAIGRDETNTYFDANSYDIVIGDLSEAPEELGLLKQLQDKNKAQCIFAFVSPKDTDKLYGIADLGMNAFELIPEQLTQALETMAEFDPYAEAV